MQSEGGETVQSPAHENPGLNRPSDQLFDKLQYP